MKRWARALQLGIIAASLGWSIAVGILLTPRSVKADEVEVAFDDADFGTMCARGPLYDVGPYTPAYPSGNTPPSYSSLWSTYSHQASMFYGWFAPDAEPGYYDSGTKTLWKWKMAYTKWRCVRTDAGSYVTSPTGGWSGYSEKEYQEVTQPTGSFGGNQIQQEQYCLYLVRYNSFGQITSMTPLECWYQ